MQVQSVGGPPSAKHPRSKSGLQQYMQAIPPAPPTAPPTDKPPLLSVVTHTVHRQSRLTQTEMRLQTIPPQV